MAPKVLRGGAVLAALVLAAYWYLSPYIAVHDIKTAADRRDADTFNNYVDYPKLRESLKAQFSAMLTETMGDVPKGSGERLSQFGTTLGSVITYGLVNKLVDDLVRPEIVMRTMQYASLWAGKKEADDASEAGHKTQWSLERKGINKLIARPTNTWQMGTPVVLVFQREGFADWKLTELRLPIPPQ